MSSPSDAPVRPGGLHARAGNAMSRTRSSILAAAGRCVERAGVRKTTMADVAAEARVAKATLYNHFRTKDDLLAALVLARVEALGERAAGAGLAAAFEGAAGALAADGAVRRLAADEPALLLAMARPGPGRAWAAARGAVAGVLAAAGVSAGPVAVDLVLRWLCGHLLWAATAEELAAGAGLLADGLGRLPAAAAFDAQASGAVAAGVGWPQ